jgi:hypothetical protein
MWLRRKRLSLRRHEQGRGNNSPPHLEKPLAFVPGTYNVKGNNTTTPATMVSGVTTKVKTGAVVLQGSAGTQKAEIASWVHFSLRKHSPLYCDSKQCLKARIGNLFSHFNRRHVSPSTKRMPLALSSWRSDGFTTRLLRFSPGSRLQRVAPFPVFDCTKIRFRDRWVCSSLR